MRALLKRFLVFMGSNNRDLFWGCWFFLVVPIFAKFFMGSRETLASGPSPRRGIAMIFLLIIIVWGWKVLWNVLQREKFMPVRDAVILLGGFLVIHFIFLVPAFIVVAALGVLLPDTLTGFILDVLMILTAFICGCWIGFKRKRLIWFWCVAGMCLLGLLAGTTISDVKSLSFGDYAFYLVPVLMGGYFARSELCENENAADKRLISYRPPD